MKLLNFAIASIVDANTHYLQGSDTPDYNAAMRHGREIRGKSVVASLKALARSLRSAYETYRDRSAEKREIATLLHMNDALLRDIGVSRDELIAAHYGFTSLAEVQARRTAHLEANSQQIAKSEMSVSIDREDAAANEAHFASAKCA